MTPSRWMIDPSLQRALEVWPGRPAAPKAQFGAQVIAICEAPFANLTWYATLDGHSVPYSQIDVAANSHDLAGGLVA